MSTLIQKALTKYYLFNNKIFLDYVIPSMLKGGMVLFPHPTIKEMQDFFKDPEARGLFDTIAQHQSYCLSSVRTYKDFLLVANDSTVTSMLHLARHAKAMELPFVASMFGEICRHNCVRALSKLNKAVDNYVTWEVVIDKYVQILREVREEILCYS